MRMLIGLAAATALILAPATGWTQDQPKPEKEKPGVMETVGGAVGGIVASSAGTAAGGPLGGAAAGLAGKKVGKGVGGFVGKIFKRRKAEPPMEVAETPPPGHIASAPLDVPPVEASAAPPIAPE